MREYNLTIGTEDLDNISREERTKILEELSENIDGDLEYEYPPKLLSSPIEDAILTIGTVMLSNRDHLIHIFETIIKNPNLTLQAVSISTENKFIFQLPEEVNVDVNVNILTKSNDIVLYESEEKPEVIKQSGKEQFIESVNRIQPDGEEFESYEEFEEEYGRE